MVNDISKLAGFCLMRFYTLRALTSTFVRFPNGCAPRQLSFLEKYTFDIYIYIYIIL